MAMKTKKILAAVLGLLFFQSTLLNAVMRENHFAQEVKLKTEIQYGDATGVLEKPEAGVAVTLVNKTGLFTVHPDALTGEFYFVNIPVGVYDLKLFKPGSDVPINICVVEIVGGLTTKIGMVEVSL
jgi:hypothetical protein